MSVRKLASIAVLGTLLVSISACSTPTTNFACVVEGNTGLVSADGAFGADPEVTFPTPLIASSVGVKETIVGDGETVPAGGVVGATVYLFDGESGELVAGGGRPALFPTDDFALPFTDTFQCGSVGSRIVATGTASEMLGGQAAQFQLDSDATIVVVGDISLGFLGRADGADQLAQEGMPAIVLAPNGQPGFTFPDSSAPTELRVDLLKKGAGAEASADDLAVIHFSAMYWRGDALIESTWGTGPTVVQVGGAAAGAISAEVAEALVGQTVGSQLLIAVPGDQTVVYVVDVLGIVE